MILITNLQSGFRCRKAPRAVQPAVNLKPEICNLQPATNLYQYNNRLKQ